MPNCPECVFKKRNVIIEEHKDDEDVNLNQLLDEVEVLMKFDPVTKHFICKRCGLYATIRSSAYNSSMVPGDVCFFGFENLTFLIPSTTQLGRELFFAILHLFLFAFLPPA